MCEIYSACRDALFPRQDLRGDIFRSASCPGRRGRRRTFCHMQRHARTGYWILQLVCLLLLLGHLFLCACGGRFACFSGHLFLCTRCFRLTGLFFARAVADLFVFLGVFSSVASSVWVSPSPHLRFASVRQLSQVTSTQSWTLANRHTSSVSKANLTFRQHESIDPCAITTFWQSRHFWYWARSSKRARCSETVEFSLNDDSDSGVGERNASQILRAVSPFLFSLPLLPIRSASG